jgi:hypothetical protein
MNGADVGDRVDVNFFFKLVNHFVLVILHMMNAFTPLAAILSAVTFFIFISTQALNVAVTTTVEQVNVLEFTLRWYLVHNSCCRISSAVCHCTLQSVGSCSFRSSVAPR